MTLESGNRLLHAAVSAATPEGSPIAIPDATVSLKAVSHQAWEALLQDPLVVARKAELEAARFLERARAVAEHGDWEAIRRMIAEARRRFADHPWVTEVLEGMAEIAKEMDAARFRKEAMYSSRKMASRVSAKDELPAITAAESDAPSFLRRKKLQGRAQFERRPDDTAQ